MKRAIVTFEIGASQKELTLEWGARIDDGELLDRATALAPDQAEITDTEIDYNGDLLRP